MLDGMRHALSIMGWIFAAYIFGYMAVRVTHTQHYSWEDATTTDYTGIYIEQRTDKFLYYVYYPLVRLDEMMTCRECVLIS